MDWKKFALMRFSVVWRKLGTTRVMRIVLRIAQGVVLSNVVEIRSPIYTRWSLVPSVVVGYN